MRLRIKNSTYLWIITLLITLGAAYYQRITGPTQPLRGVKEIGPDKLKYKLIRTFGGPGDAEITINDEKSEYEGSIRFKRYKSYDEWTSMSLKRRDGKLVGYLPHQPPAGKMEYYIIIYQGSKQISLTDELVILRFKGDVPAGVLIPHIILMFLAMLFSTRAGIEVLAKGRNTFKLSWLTLLFLFTGGLIFGPIVQKYAFGAYWTGFPFGYDLTDNKTAIAFIFWAWAVFKLWRNPNQRGWALLASVVLMLIYLIPHSTLGSEIDHTALPQ
jgi:hypothetical protein